jgi:hypothetical protein
LGYPLKQVRTGFECLIDMISPEWKYVETVEKKIRTIKVNLKERHMDAVDMETMMPFCLDADSSVDLEKIKKAKIYRATIKVFKAQLTGELESQLKEMAIEDPQLQHSLQAIKAAGSILKKYELIRIK